MYDQRKFVYTLNDSAAKLKQVADSHDESVAKLCSTLTETVGKNAPLLRKMTFSYVSEDDIGSGRRSYFIHGFVRENIPVHLVETHLHNHCRRCSFFACTCRFYWIQRWHNDKFVDCIVIVKNLHVPLTMRDYMWILVYLMAFVVAIFGIYYLACELLLMWHGHDISWIPSGKA